MVSTPWRVAPAYKPTLVLAMLKLQQRPEAPLEGCFASTYADESGKCGRAQTLNEKEGPMLAGKLATSYWCRLTSAETVILPPGASPSKL